MNQIHHISVKFLNAIVTYEDFGDGYGDEFTKLLALLIKMEFDFDCEFWITEEEWIEEEHNEDS